MTEDEEKQHAAFRRQLEEEAAAKMAAFQAAVEAIGAEVVGKVATLVLEDFDSSAKH